ncbi:MAG: regulatory protein RecX [Lachnospiraceae bacterium]|nr:regulatory protein RecX [Lachnospiraceae bacterium]
MVNNPGDSKAAYNSAIDMLSRRDRSEKDLYDRLIKKGFEENAVADAITKLKDKHYIDDVRMAAHFISAHLSGQSLAQIKFKLMSKGIGSEDIAAAIAQVSDEAVDDSETVRSRQAAAVAEILKKKKFDDNEQSSDKILASLSRKGFSYDIIREGIFLYKEELSEED